MPEIKYFHDEEHHNLIAPSIIVPHLINSIKPTSVIDIGCGIGTFLHVFSSNGVDTVFGIDGEWVNKELLSKYISLENFKIANLEDKIFIARKYDLAISLEVAEHLKESSAETMVENLVQLSDVIVFSAAFPGQEGQNHINEQWPNYWENIFNKYNYSCYDILRPFFWNNENVPLWYKQNMFLVLKNGRPENEKIINGFTQSIDSKLLNIIHPGYFEIFYNKSIELEMLKCKYDNLLKGRESLILYIKLLIKFLFKKIGLYHK